jgi:hypothetical protein
MALRYYSNTSVATTLAAPINGSDTSMTVSAASGFPGSFPYTMIVDYGAATAEVVEVSAAAGTTLTITRGVDNTSAQAHGLGAVVVHGISKRDVSEPNSHIDASVDVHGLAAGAAVVGSTSTQTLTNKTISGASNTLTSLPAANVTGNLSGVSSVTSSGAIVSSSTVTGTALIPTGLTGATAVGRYVGATTGGAPGSGTFAVGDFIIDRTGKIFVCTTAGTPGTWTNVASLYLPLAGGTLTGGLIGTTATFTGAVGGLSLSATNAVTARNAELIGTSDIVQLSVKGNGTQTSNLQEWKNSANTVVAQMSNAGNFQCDGTATLDGNVIGGTTHVIDVSNSGAFNITAANISLTWNTNDAGDATMHNTGANTSRLVAPIAGRYHVEANVATGLQSAGAFDLMLRANGAGTDFRKVRLPSNTSSNNYLAIHGCVVLAASGYVEVRAATTGGATNTVQAETRAHMRYIGPV